MPDVTTISVEDPAIAEHLASDGTVYIDDDWVFQMVPTGIIYRSYYAAPKEPRMGAVIDHDSESNAYFDGTIGGRIGIFRIGNTDNRYPQGWQVDIEAAAFPRLDLREERDLVDTDFRVGVPVTYGSGPMQVKFAYYHISAHVGDEFIVKNPTFTRVNYVRDGFVLGLSYYLEGVNLPIETRLYGEMDWAFNTSGGAEPWAFQMGVEIAANECGPTIFGASPFLAVNGDLREEVDFGGTFALQTGILWRARDSTGTLRFGFEYINGKNVNFERFTTFEARTGIGLWYDF